MYAYDIVMLVNAAMFLPFGFIGLVTYAHYVHSLAITFQPRQHWPAASEL